MPLPGQSKTAGVPCAVGKQVVRPLKDEPAVVGDIGNVALRIPELPRIRDEADLPRAGVVDHPGCRVDQVRLDLERAVVGQCSGVHKVLRPARGCKQQKCQEKRSCAHESTTMLVEHTADSSVVLCHGCVGSFV
jgi:hypothetical protein